jgi:hypothetical protein
MLADGYCFFELAKTECNHYHLSNCLRDSRGGGRRDVALQRATAQTIKGKV